MRAELLGRPETSKGEGKFVGVPPHLRMSSEREGERAKEREATRVEKMGMTNILFCFRKRKTIFDL